MSKPLHAFGQRKTLTQWCAEYAIPINRVSSRLQRGWTLEQALTAPANAPSPVVKPVVKPDAASRDVRLLLGVTTPEEAAAERLEELRDQHRFFAAALVPASAALPTLRPGASATTHLQVAVERFECLHQGLVNASRILREAEAGYQARYGPLPERPPDQSSDLPSDLLSAITDNTPPDLPSDLSSDLSPNLPRPSHSAVYRAPTR